VRRWVPELEGLSADEIHEPWKLPASRRRGYPEPVVEHAEAVLAIERLVVAQAIEWRVAMIGGVAEAHTIPDADKQAVEFEHAVRGRANDIALFLGQGTRDAYLAVRAVTEPVFHDRPLSDDVSRVRGVITAGTRN